MSAFKPYHYNKEIIQDFTYFRLSEFRCKCCRCQKFGYPAKLNAKLLTYLEQTRIHFGKAMIVTSGLRCKAYNSKLKGASKNSAHLSGRAADVWIKDVDPKEIRDYWKSLNVGYSYCGTPNMGDACHVQIGW